MPTKDDYGRQPPPSARVPRQVPGLSFDWFLVSLYAVAHFFGDSYGCFLAPLLPEFKRRFLLSKFMCGSLAAAQTTTISLTQPLLGYASDRLQSGHFLVFGPILGGVFFSLIGNAHSFGSLMALLVIGGFGIAAFHPTAAVLAARAGGRKRHLSLAIYVSGGILGCAAGYQAVVMLVDALGLERLGVAMVPALFLGAVLYKYVPRRMSGGGQRPSDLVPATGIPRPLRFLFVVGVCRGMLGNVVGVLTPLLLAERGYPLAAGGNALALYMLFGCGGNILGGWLTERIGPRAVIFTSYLLAFPALLGFSLSHGPGHFGFLMLSGLLLMAPMSAEIGLAQRLLPRHVGAVSGVFTGGIWGLGGLSMMGVGALADRIGTEHTMLAVWPLALVAAGVATALPQLPPHD